MSLETGGAIVTAERKKTMKLELQITRRRFYFFRHIILFSVTTKGRLHQRCRIEFSKVKVVKDEKGIRFNTSNYI